MSPTPIDQQNADKLQKLYAERAEITSGVKVLLSFGARQGGYKYAISLRRFINRSMGWDDDSTNVYIDSEALEKHPFTKPGSGGLNPIWDNIYWTCINQCKVMVFLVTKPWLDSPNCRQEIEWWKINKGSVPVICLMFKDAADDFKDGTFWESEFREFCSSDADFLLCDTRGHEITKFVTLQPAAFANFASDGAAVLSRIQHYVSG